MSDSKVEILFLNEEDMERFEKLLSMLDDCEDVQNVYHNITI